MKHLKFTKLIRIKYMVKKMKIRRAMKDSYVKLLSLILMIPRFPQTQVRPSGKSI